MKRCFHPVWLPIVLLAASWVEAQQFRDWTDRQGRSVRAVFVRIYEQQAVFRQAGRFVKVPLRDLAEEDAAIAQALSELAQRRDWRHGQDTVNGRFRGYNGGTVRVQVGAKSREIPAAELRAVNLDLVRTWARAFGRDDGQLPEVASATEQRARPAMPEMPVDTMAEFGWQEAAKTSDERTWTNTSGSQIVAGLVSADSINVVLKRAGKEYTVPISSLSAADRDYVHGLSDPLSGPRFKPPMERKATQGGSETLRESPATPSAALDAPSAALAEQSGEAKRPTSQPTFDDAFSETVDELMKAEPPNLDQGQPAKPDEMPSKDLHATAPVIASVASRENTPAATAPDREKTVEAQGKVGLENARGRSPSHASTPKKAAPTTSRIALWLLAGVASIAGVVVVGLVLIKRRKRS